MKTRAYKTGFTLVEMIVVIAIIAILISMVVTIAKRIDDQGKERLTKGTITLLGSALEQFRDFGYEYKSTDYAGLVFPLDCNGYNLTSTSPYPNLPATLQSALGLSATNIYFSGAVGTYNPTFSGSEALYFILRQVPDCRDTLDKIDKSLLTNKDPNGNSITITIGASPALPFTRIVDPWGTTLRYDYYPEYADYILANPGGSWQKYLSYRNSALKTFPVITSAGPDKQFDTADDISNVK
ncbi:MAG: prepilin-type N-terminal cleavage/methylation domain-containing protein [Sedimentisphaerales bacterium]|jgi:prepilin-type N-terminal cleavage/methylation domain-containing protein